MKSVNELRGKALGAYTEWGDLDLNYKVVAASTRDKCIGCDLCYVACMDGAHQCIHLPVAARPSAQGRAHAHPCR
jgi:dihydropyrimidine dehydrogenase (NAD+) subunit PreA